MGKADTHLHTEYSGFNELGVIKFPESTTQPERQVDRMRRLGMDVMAITDHDETEGAFIAQKYARANFDDIEVVVGEEITTADGEIIGLFLSEKIEKGLPVEETVDIIRSQGGLVIAPHPFSMHTPGLQERILGLDIDGFETVNGGHPDAYANMLARIVMDRYPGRWAETSGSDAHSVYTSGYNWTEFSGTSADDYRRAILNRTTVAVGEAAPVFGQVQWSVDVVIGGQRLLYQSLLGRLKNVPHDHLIEKINSITDLKKATGIFAGLLYVIPPISFIATIMSTSYLKDSAAEMTSWIPERLARIDRIVRAVDAAGGPGAAGPRITEIEEAIGVMKSHRRPIRGLGRL